MAVRAAIEAPVRPKTKQRGPVRDDFVPKDAYISRDFLRLENERLWPKVWQIACRLEEIPKVGDYVTYEVAGESIIVIRTGARTIKSFHNVCQHRGRRLKEPSSSGNAATLYCRYHGWSWKIDGSVERILDPQDWEGCDHFGKADLRLKETLVDTWGGWVFINMDLDAEPLRDYLDPVPKLLGPFEFETMRYRWYKTAIMPCNWKVALEAFNEGYHVAATHPQLLKWVDDVTRSFTFGKHGMFAYPTARPFGAESARFGRPMQADIRPGIVAIMKELDLTLKAQFSERATHASARLLTEVPAKAPVMEVFEKWYEFQREAAESGGAGWPKKLGMAEMGAAGTDWHVFPNHIFLMSPDALLAYRARPNGDDPDTCIFDIWSLVRYAPGMEPALKREFYPDGRVNPVESFGLILSQDIANMGEVQAGMHSRGFVGSRTNPVQESTVSSFHRTLREYLAKEP